MIVVGAGFSGLASAIYLLEAGYKVEIFEEQERPGGLISSRQTSFGLVETAANGLLNSPEVESLFDLVGVPILPTRKEARRRFIFRDGKPNRWPIGFGASMRVLMALFRYFIVRKSIVPNEGETVRDWGHRAFGFEATTYLLEAALQGIYAGDPGKMSATAIFGKLFRPSKAIKRPRPRIRGTVSARHGMGELIAAMERYLKNKGAEIHYGRKFDFEFEYNDSASSENSSRFPVVIATSASRAGKILVTLDPDRSQILNEIELLPIVSVTVHFAQSLKDLKGFGCLFPPAERRRALGVLFNGSIFENRENKSSSETWIMGGASIHGRDLLQLSDAELIEVIQSEREAVFGDRGKVLSSFVTRWPEAIPHYTVDLEWRLSRLQGLSKNVILVGNYLGAIGLAKILDRAKQIPNLIKESGRWH